MKNLIFLLTACALGVASAKTDASSALAVLGTNTTLVVSADRMLLDREAGTVSASGSVSAQTGPYRLLSDRVEQISGGATGTYRTFFFGDDTMVTTCTNELDNLHWCAFGSVEYSDHKNGEKVSGEPDEFIGRDMSLKFWGYPVAWVPYVWIPRNTDYGWRVMPGYTSRWGAYLLTKYVYTLYESPDRTRKLGANTRFDLRTENGIAVGEGVNWRLGDFGRGKFKVYYAWDQDADRYDKHWNTSKEHYSNWGSDVPDERYGLMFEHRWDASEDDVVRARAAYYSDSHFRADFIDGGMLGLANRYVGADHNELAWEHREDTLALGVSVSGPLNDFYGGTARLPEISLDIAPQPLFGLPVNYESQTTLGWYNRNYARLGNSQTDLSYRYNPGLWADYQSFRADTYHRLTLPFKVEDVLSVVPRIGLRGTWWADSGTEDLTGRNRASSRDDDVSRFIIEGGVTFAARGTGWLDDRWQHLVEPYLDVLAQEAEYSGLGSSGRAFLFDSADGSTDWLDQYAGRSRNLPYSWYGFTPGVRNAFRKADENGKLRTVFDIDVYAAVQLNDTEWTAGNRYHRLTRDPEDPNYGRDGKVTVNPGLRARWFATDDVALMSRVEWDGENDTVAYADVSFQHQVRRDFKYEISYSGRDQRLWDYSSTPYNSATMRNEDFNWSKFSYGQIMFEHEICDAIVWGPFIRWDFRENEFDEAGGWIDFRTDCLGFRFSLSYENDYTRIDGSERGDNWRAGISIYLRALGPSSAFAF